MNHQDTKALREPIPKETDECPLIAWRLGGLVVKAVEICKRRCR